MRVARAVSQLERAPRAAAVGSFDGVHLGHRRVLQAAVDAGLRSTVVTFYPHPRTVLGNQVDLLATLERRLEFLDDAGVDEALVVEFTPELAEYEPEEFAEGILRPIGTEVVVAGENFRFGRARRGDLSLLERLGFDVRRVRLLEGVSSTRIRELLRAGEVEQAARVLGRPPEVEGVVVAGDARGGTLGFPTANLRVDPELLVPEYGIYAGATAGHRAAVSIGVNPHYGGTERRVEVYLLDFEGDLYGARLVVELWERLRDERAFESEAELVEQIAEDVERTRLARPPVLPSKGGKS
jgi:riboflavin kinase / FMN adenylyltransferase